MANKTYCGNLTMLVMLRKLFFVIGLIGIFLVTGCATQTAGNKFDDSKISLIKNGKSNKENVLTLLGEPYLKNTSLDGILTWSYQYSEQDTNFTAMSFVPILNLTKGGNANRSAKNLTISFNKSGVVASCIYQTSQRHSSDKGAVASGVVGIVGAGEDTSTNCEDVK